MRDRGLGILLVFFVTSCASRQEPATPISFYEPQEGKLKQKTVNLQKKLEIAEKNIIEDQQILDRLRAQLCDAEMNIIEVKVENYEKKWRSNPDRFAQLGPDLFLNDRETLNRIIRTGISTQKAQLLLDRVLELITQISETKGSNS